MSDSVTIKLNSDEVLVFFDWIGRFNELEDQEFQDRAEEIVLWNIEGQIETVLVEPFMPNYSALLDAARARIRDTIEE